MTYEIREITTLDAQELRNGSYGCVGTQLQYNNADSFFQPYNQAFILPMDMNHLRPVRIAKCVNCGAPGNPSECDYCGIGKLYKAKK